MPSVKPAYVIPIKVNESIEKFQNLSKNQYDYEIKDDDSKESLKKF